MNPCDVGDPQKGKDLKNKERLAWIFRKEDVIALHCQNRKINPYLFDIGNFFTKKYGTFPMPTQWESL